MYNEYAATGEKAGAHGTGRFEMGTLIDRVLADGHIRNDQERDEVWQAIVAFEHAEADRAETAYLAEQVRLADEADAAFEEAVVRFLDDTEPRFETTRQ